MDSPNLVKENKPDEDEALNSTSGNLALRKLLTTRILKLSVEQKKLH